MICSCPLPPPFFFYLFRTLPALVFHYPETQHLPSHYADDVQLYLSFDPKVDGATQICVERLSNCIAEISEWMRVNKLKLTDQKTEFFIASLTYNSRFIQDITIKIGNTIILESASIRNLGVVFRQCLIM